MRSIVHTEVQVSIKKDKAMLTINVLVYANKLRYDPFTQWLNGLQDKQIRIRILARLSRLQQGNYGDFQSVGNGVFELRLFFGSGYRIYFGKKDRQIVVLLCGGDKNSQHQDIDQAQTYWNDYLS